MKLKTDVDSHAFSLQLFVAMSLFIALLGTSPAMAVDSPNVRSDASRLTPTKAQNRTTNLARPLTIGLGETYEFPVSDGGSTACVSVIPDFFSDIFSLLPLLPGDPVTCRLDSRYGFGFVPDVLGLLNRNDPSTNFVKVYVDLPVAPIIPVPNPIPGHASAAVFNEFTVAGSDHTPVDAQISVTFDYIGMIVGATVYRDELSIGLKVEDITSATNILPVGALSLFTQGRDGDQGLTDVAGSAEIVPVADETNGFTVKVLKGHTYRVSFELGGDNFGVGLVSAEARWSKLVVSIDGACEKVSQQRKIQGCNGLDDDCDGVVDECDEDTFGPDVHIDQSVTKGCYDTVAEAAEAVAAAVNAADDCGGITIADPVVSGSQCDVTIGVTATDDCGNFTTANTVVRIDGDGPSISIDPLVADVCYASIDDAEQAVLDAATITDNCNLIDDLSITVHTTVEECALRVRLKVVDKCGNESIASVTVRVDPHMPTVDVRALRLGFRGEVLGFQTPVCYESVAQAEGAVLAVTHAEDNCTESEQLLTSVSSSDDLCSLQVTSKAIDECSNENIDSVTVRVDSQSPEVTCEVEIDRLLPPNHEMINVGFTFTATDNCTSKPQIDVFITSDETTASASGAGQASPAPDAFVLRDLDGVFRDILLRAERSSEGNGRVYQITVRATDECGNIGSCSATVSVSPSSNSKSLDDGQYYDATKVN